MSFSDAARGMLELQGREVTLRREGAEDAEAVALLAIVSDYGFGLAPSSWPDAFTSGMARYAAFRLHPEDMAEPEPGSRNLLLFAGREYEIRVVRLEPACFGADGPLWIVALGVADQRGLA